MPNHKLSAAVRDEIINKANGLASRRLNYATGKFPLTVATIQHAIISPDQLSLLRKLQGTGYKQAPKTRTPTIRITRDAYPGLLRGLPVTLQLPEAIYEPQPSYFPEGTEFMPGKEDWTLPLPYLDAADRVLVAAWANNVVRELRLREIATSTVRLVMGWCKSTAEVLAAWPMLGTLVEDEEWRLRFRQPPRNVHRWAPDPVRMAPGVWADSQKRIAASEVVLNGAVLLEPYKPETNAVLATRVQSWERLATDRRYNK